MSALATALVLACAVCGGDASADQVRGARLGVIVLLCVVVVLLIAIGAVVRSWARRAEELERVTR